MLKRILVLTMIVALAGCATCNTCTNPPSGKACKQKGTCPMEAKTLRHVVLFKFKDAATPDQVKSVEKAFQALPTKIDVIRGFEWGTDISPEKLSQGFTHCYVLTFKSEVDRDTYIAHPDHKAFGKILGPYLDKVCVVDFWTQH